jgi:hypothetical protein
MVDEVVLAQGFLNFFCFPLLIIPLLLCIYLLPPHKICGIPGHATDYRTFCPTLASSLIRRLADHGVKADFLHHVVLIYLNCATHVRNSRDPQVVKLIYMENMRDKLGALLLE